MKKLKILSIDDSQSNLLLIESMFEDDDRIHVLLKSNGIDIINYCMKHEPDIILLDLMMPDINGFEILEIVKADNKLKNIPIIVISALDSKKHIKQVLELGAIDYIVKPLDPVENTKQIYHTLGIDPV